MSGHLEDMTSSPYPNKVLSFLVSPAPHWEECLAWRRCIPSYLTELPHKHRNVLEEDELS